VNVYADHNFLIYCIKHPLWRDAVVAHVSEKAALVLSPWHFYEYGNASGHADTEELIQFAEMVQAKWTMERADLLTVASRIIWHISELIIWRTSCESGVKRLGEGIFRGNNEALDASPDQRGPPGTIVYAR
jgi:hypothetical protein